MLYIYISFRCVYMFANKGTRNLMKGLKVYVLIWTKVPGTVSGMGERAKGLLWSETVSLLSPNRSRRSTPEMVLEPLEQWSNSHDSFSLAASTRFNEERKKSYPVSFSKEVHACVLLCIKLHMHITKNPLKINVSGREKTQKYVCFFKNIQLLLCVHQQKCWTTNVVKTSSLSKVVSWNRACFSYQPKSACFQ